MCHQSKYISAISCTTVVLFVVMFLVQRLFATQRGREGHSSEGAEGLWEWSIVSSAAEDSAVWTGLPPQWPDQRRAQAGGGSLLVWDTLPPHLHIHAGRWDQPTSPQVSKCFGPTQREAVCLCCCVY